MTNQRQHFPFPEIEPEIASLASAWRASVSSHLEDESNESAGVLFCAIAFAERGAII
jgi:hypothetical protein